MKNSIRILKLLCISSIFYFSLSCNKNDEVTLASIVTDSLRAVGSKSLQIGGIISSDGNDVVTRGVCWSTAHAPTIYDDTIVNGKGKGSFVSYIKNLNSNTKYYFRAYATNSAGTSYGNVIEVTTTQMVTDYDGNIYNTIKIGNQLWMAENLKTTHYRNGDPINAIRYGMKFRDLKEGYYTNSERLGMGLEIFGAYYNWLAINDSRKICPEGWHIPSDDEWKTMLNTIGENDIAKKLLLNDYSYSSLMDGATNSSGFSAVPAGYCIDVLFEETTSISVPISLVSLWSSTEVNDTSGSSIHLNILFGGSKPILAITPKSFAEPVRCIKD